MYRYQQGVSPYQVTLSRHDLCRMIKLVRTLQQLSGQQNYRKKIIPDLPEAGRFDPGHHSVMMGYDFHLGDTGPQLIEINTNNGGAWLACQACRPGAKSFPAVTGKKILGTFLEEFAAWKRVPEVRPRNIVIMDEQPEKQFLYQEMQVFADLFRQAKINVSIIDPGELSFNNDGVFYHGNSVDLIYNRHCDFYLQTPDMADIRIAWMANKMCLTPNPHTYGLLADKQRMILWSDPEQREALGFNEKQSQLVGAMVPRISRMDSFDSEALWRTRKQWVFKPVSSYACKGVYVGKKLTKNKFNELDPQTTVVQGFVPPSKTCVVEGESFKTDYRLFTYRDQVLGVTARLYRGQVTNLQTEGGGFAAVKII